MQEDVALPEPQRTAVHGVVPQVAEAEVGQRDSGRELELSLPLTC